MSFLKGVFEELNLARTDPKKFAEKVERIKADFEGNNLRIPGTNTLIQTREGPKGYEEAIEYLKNKEPLPAIIGSNGLRKIAKEYKDKIKDLEPSKTGTVDLGSIINKYGSFMGNFSRIVDFGAQTPERVVINILVGDGDPKRRQRNIILGENFKKIGISHGKHGIYRHFTILTLTTEFTNPNDPEDKEDFEIDDVDEETKKEEIKKEEPKKEEIKKEEPKKEEPKKEEPKKEEPKKEEPKKIEPPKRVEPKIVEPPKKVTPSEPLKDGVERVEKTEKIIVEGGRKKKLITITTHLKDGTTKVETKKEPLK